MVERDIPQSQPERVRAAFADVDPDPLDSRRIHRFVKGIDTGPSVMTDEEIAEELNDPFAVLLLRQGKFPVSLKEILAGIDAATADGDDLRRQMSFLVGEGSQIPWSQETGSLRRELRLAVTRGRDNEIDLLISTDAVGTSFLQVMGWDRENGVFHFYERRKDRWIWAGNSTHALDPRSRGEGPFDSHVNGAMVMKELKFPWTHWHSVSATVPPEIFPPDHPAREDPLFLNRSGAEVFEPRVVMPGVRRWTDSRFAKTVGPDGKVEQARALLEQLFVTTTVNLVSSGEESRTLQPGKSLALPATFFADVDAFAELEITDPQPFEAPADSYLTALQRFEFALVDGDFRQDGDTHFAWLVPERAFEDLDVVKKCLETELLSERFVASALMVDFPNPIFSPRRAKLLQYAPGQVDAGAARLDDQTAAAIEQAASGLPAGGPEHEFLATWQLGDGWRASVEERLQRYYASVAERLRTTEGFEDFVRLAETRRRQAFGLDVSEGRPLLFAQTNIPPSPGSRCAQTPPSQRRSRNGGARALHTSRSPQGSLSPRGLKQYSDTLSRMFDDAAVGGGDPRDSPRAQFFNPTRTDPAADAKEKGIFWTAFPRLVRLRTATDVARWRLADASRDNQDEYCEWAVHRNEQGKVVRVVFTCELPEYWQALAADNPRQLLALYKELVGPQVRERDIFDSQGKYIPRNKWNNRTDVGPVHMIQKNNTLSAAVELSAAATIPRVINNRVLTSEQELIRCGDYGEAQRNSDPHIGAGINELARRDADITLADPAGLYINDFTPAGWTTPDGSDPKSFWRYVRGERGRRLRGVYEVPVGKRYVVGDIKINGRPIRSGGQIADFVSVRVTGVACRFGQRRGRPFTRCKGQI